MHAHAHVVFVFIRHESSVDRGFPTQALEFRLLVMVVWRFSSAVHWVEGRETRPPVSRQQGRVLALPP
jgi:hypothetical protein